jgi:hypothetical protein
MGFYIEILLIEHNWVHLVGHGRAGQTLPACRNTLTAAW